MTFLRLPMLEQDTRIASTCAILSQELNLELRWLSATTTSVQDLCDMETCRETLHNFAARIHSPKLRCASSMFVKYWASIWILPFLYSHAAAHPFIKWHAAALVVDLPHAWYWDRCLQLRHAAYDTIQPITFSDLEQMLQDLKRLFLQIARIGRVSYALLWENAAVRVVQFYRSLDHQSYKPEMHEKLLQQQHWLQAKSAAYFQLEQNPFNKLWANWQPADNCYMRARCCFYFQLPEAQQSYCHNCPLNLNKKESHS